MRKKTPSKLDQYSKLLQEWFTPTHLGGKGYTLNMAKERLQEEGVSVSIGRLSDWWSTRREEIERAKTLEKFIADKSWATPSFKSSEVWLQNIAQLHSALFYLMAEAGASDFELLMLAIKATELVKDMGEKEAAADFRRLAAKCEHVKELQSLAKDKSIAAAKKLSSLKAFFGLRNAPIQLTQPSQN